MRVAQYVRSCPRLCKDPEAAGDAPMLSCDEYRKKYTDVSCHDLAMGGFESADLKWEHAGKPDQVGAYVPWGDTPCGLFCSGCHECKEYQCDCTVDGCSKCPDD